MSELHLAHEPNFLQRAAVLARLKEAGKLGVHFYELRDLLDGNSAERCLSELRDLGYPIARSPSSTGVRAILVRDPDELGVAE